MPFVSGQPLVRQAGDQDWIVEEPIVYQGNQESFAVPVGYETDFASVPRFFTWLIPTYGAYTRPAILHDWLCDQARAGRITRADADGLFRRSMRELGVGFGRRWLMWSGVRAQSVKVAGVAQLFDPSWRSFVALLLIWVLTLGYLFVPTLVIAAALLAFLGLEWMLYPFVLLIGRRVAPQKQVNRPRASWKL
jgi:hypothetical protein